MLQLYRIASGVPQKIASALASHGAIVTAARRFRLFDKDGPCSTHITLNTLSQATTPGELELLWRQWIVSETATRYVPFS